jgi:sec-independent protein translocase protein TatB
MFGIGSTELLLILVVALIVLGPRNLPKIANTLGKAMGQFQRASRDFQRSINTEIAFEEEQEKKKAEQKQAETAQASEKVENKEETKA